MSEPTAPRPLLGWLAFGGCLCVVFGLGLLLASVLERRQESRPERVLVPVGDLEVDSATWGINHPRQFASWRKTDESTSKTKYGGAWKRDLLEETPANVILFAGYPFAKDYKQARGHMHTVADVNESGRPNPTFPATCWTCKSPDVVRLMAEMGPEKFYAAKMSDLKPQVTQPLGCLDCHDPKTMALRLTRPALTEALTRRGTDPAKVSHQEMRSLVCAQCHVEYYFKGDGKYLTFPWDKGLGIEEIAAYYDEYGFSDWKHAISGAPMVKQQHPDYEIYTKGIHAYRNVSCADCHMPYRSEGGTKFTDHHIRSPLLNISNTCTVCHRWGEDEIRTRVEAIQDKIARGRSVAESAIARAHFDIRACMQAGASDDDLKPLRTLVRAAQLRWDYVAAHNGMGFHAPQECQRILGEAAELAQECRVSCARLLAVKGHTMPVTYPPFASKAEAQALIARFAPSGEPPNLLTPVR